MFFVFLSNRVKDQIISSEKKLVDYTNFILLLVFMRSKYQRIKLFTPFVDRKCPGNQVRKKQKKIHIVLHLPYMLSRDEIRILFIACIHLSYFFHLFDLLHSLATNSDINNEKLNEDVATNVELKSISTLTKFTAGSQKTRLYFNDFQNVHLFFCNCNL